MLNLVNHGQAGCAWISPFPSRGIIGYRDEFLDRHEGDPAS